MLAMIPVAVVLAIGLGVIGWLEYASQYGRVAYGRL